MFNLKIFLIAVLTVCAFSPLASSDATQDKNNDSQERKVVTVPAGEVINKDYLGAGEIVEISGTVNGDVYVAGGQVLINGKINGDLLAVGGAVKILGYIAQDARVIAGRQIFISGEIGRNLTVAGGNVELTNSARVHRGIVAAGGNVSLAGPVGNDVKVAAGSLTVSNTIDGNLDAVVGEIYLTSKAAVIGDLIYWSDKTALIDERAKIVGSITQRPPLKKIKSGRILEIFVGVSLLVKIISFISTLIIGLLLIHFFPNFNQATVSTLRKRPWASLGLGLVFLLLVPVVLVILSITVVGIPLAFILLALYFISLYLSKIFVLFWAGTTIFEQLGKEARKGWSFVAGLIIYFLLSHIPIIGGITAFFVLLFGLGTAVLTERDLYFTARAKKII